MRRMLIEEMVKLGTKIAGIPCIILHAHPRGIRTDNAQVRFFVLER